MFLGLKVLRVVSISSQETSAATAPAPNAQRRTAADRPLPGPPAMLEGTAGPLGLTSAALVGGIGVESWGSIGSVPSSLQARAEVMRADANAAGPTAH